MVREHTRVGGRPLVHMQTGTSAGTPADVSISCGFVPDYIMFIPDTDAASVWVYRFPGMADGQGITDTAGTKALDAADAFENATDGFVICSEIQTASKVWSVVAMRFTEDLVS